MPHVSFKLSELLAFFIPSQAYIFKYVLLSPQNISAGLLLTLIARVTSGHLSRFSLKMIFSLQESLISTASLNI